jgi:hypothetical protein
MLVATQVPESVLGKMSTAGLVETALDYPLLGDMMAFNSPQQGFDAVAGRFNGLQELLKRKDAGAELLAHYVSLDPAAYDEDWPSAQQGRYARSIAEVETLLAQDAVLSGLADAQLADLVREAVAKYRIKEESEIYGGSSTERTLWVIGKALQQARQYRGTADMSTTTTYRFYDFNEPIEIEPPPDENVVIVEVGAVDAVDLVVNSVGSIGGDDLTRQRISYQITISNRGSACMS